MHLNWRGEIRRQLPKRVLKEGSAPAINHPLRGHIDRRLVEWSGEVPLSWLPSRVSGNECIPLSITQAGLYQSHYHVYLSVQIANSWNRRHISRIRVQAVTIAQLSLQPPSLANYISQAACQNRIQQLIDDICATIPFYLGDRIKPGRIGYKSVQYPHVPGSPVPEAHYQMAPAMGGYSF